MTSPLRADDIFISGNLVIKQAWSRATPGAAKVAGGYLTILNRGRVAERLLSASTPAAKKTEIHDMLVHDGIMTMRPAEDGVVITPGTTLTLAPGGTHLMFEELAAPFHQGDTVPVTLTFEHAGVVKVAFDVQSMGTRAPERVIEKPTPPATESGADDNFFTHLHAVKAMANVTVSPGRAGLVEIDIQLENADELPLAAEAVSVTLANPEHGVAPVTTEAERVGNDQWRVKMSAPLAGRWALALGIRISATDIVNVASPILLQ